MNFSILSIFALASSAAAWSGQISYGAIDAGADAVFLTDYATGSSYTGYITDLGGSAQQV